MTTCPDGTVVSSSQQTSSIWEAGTRLYPMQGIVLSVQPSDAQHNICADSSSLRRGPRNECSVIVTGNFNDPDLWLNNVIIPPSSPSGIDNYSENLPRGCSKDLIDGIVYNPDFVEVDTSKLDGERCVVAFVGGRIDHAFIQCWWPHPHNNFDPATTGRAYKGGALQQVNLDKNRFRSVRRINGTEIVVNPFGSVYLDTQQAARSVLIKGTKPESTQIDKGGHVQVDIKPKSQFELNWNLKPTRGPRIGAGSNSSKPVFDPSLLHPDQPLDSKVPPARPTERTFIRGKSYELLLKTSNLSVFCEDSDDEPGDYIVMAQNGVTISQQPKDGSKSAAVVNIADGTISVQAADGSIVSVSDLDQITLLNKSKSMVALVGNSITISAAGGVTIPVPTVVGADIAQGAAGPAEPAILNSKLLVALSTFLTNITPPNIVPSPAPDSGAAVLAGIIAATAKLITDVASATSTQVKIGV